MERVTIYSIAQRCAVSASTVSRAFSRPELVQPDVRDRILATAEQLGYRANRSARGLATGRTGSIGLLVADITNPYFPPLIRAVQRAAEAAEASVLLVDAEESAASEARLIEQLKGQVDGMIIASPRSAAGLAQVLDGLPAVVINRRLRDIPSVICDNTRALQAAGDHVRGLGHRRFGLIRGPSASWAARQRATAVQRWASRTRSRLVDLGPYPASFDGGLDAAARLARTACTAVFAFDDLTACGVLAGLSRAGQRVPEDRVLMGCDDVLLARTVTPQLTTVSAPYGDLGETSVELLNRSIAGEPVRDVSLEGTLVLRASTDAAPPR